MTKEDLENLSALLKIGKFTINSDEALVLALLKQKIDISIKEFSKPEETTKKKTETK